MLNILEILNQLPLTVELLVTYKYGRVVKRIVQRCKEEDGVSKNDIFEQIATLAREMFDTWNNLAVQNEITPASKKRQSSPEEQTVSSLGTRCNAGIEVNISPESGSIESQESKRVKVRKVTFPGDDKLCQVIVFERDPAEYEFLSDGSASLHDYLHADKDEALNAFKASHKGDEEDQFTPWTPPSPLSKVEALPEGKDCEEKIIQGQRERTVLSTSYFSLENIPFNPSEDIVDVVDKESSIKKIPTRDSCNVQSRVIPLKVAPILSVPPMLLDIPNSSFLSSLLSNPSGVTSLLNPFTTSFEGGPCEEQRDALQPGSVSDVCNRGPSVPRPGICKFYKSRRPNSCKFGSSCSFLHRD